MLSTAGEADADTDEDEESEAQENGNEISAAAESYADDSRLYERHG